MIGKIRSRRWMSRVDCGEVLYPITQKVELRNCYRNVHRVTRVTEIERVRHALAVRIPGIHFHFDGQSPYHGLTLVLTGLVEREKCCANRDEDENDFAKPPPRRFADSGSIGFDVDTTVNVVIVGI